MSTHKTIVVMPAYNAEATLEKTINDIPFTYVHELLLVDDASKDGTYELGKKLAASHPQLTSDVHEAETGDKTLFSFIQHEKNIGYGGNQKSCYRIALEHGADIVVMLHPDYQYDPKLIKHFVEFIQEGYFDVMLGSRIRTRKETLAGGMPLYKYLANRILSFIQNIATGQSLSEWHTGMRAYTKEVLNSIEYEKFSDDFVFDTQALFAIVEKGYSIGEIPVPVRYFQEASSINFSRSVRYGTLTLIETAKFVVRKYMQVFVYASSGIAAVLTNLAVYSVLVYGFHLWYIAASVIGFGSGAVTSFTLHKYATFENRSRKKIFKEILTYILLIAFNAGANACILFLLVQEGHLQKLIANVISIGLVSLWSFFIYKYIIFSPLKSSF
jgi:glycosyltransferase involved in cell wall biosynthesis